MCLMQLSQCFIAQRVEICKFVIQNEISNTRLVDTCVQDIVQMAGNLWTQYEEPKPVLLDMRQTYKVWSIIDYIYSLRLANELHHASYALPNCFWESPAHCFYNNLYAPHT